MTDSASVLSGEGQATGQAGGDPASAPASAPAPAPNATTTTATQEGAGEANRWWSDEYNDLVTAKGWDKQDPNAVIKAYQNVEKIVGVPGDRVLKLPGEGDPDGVQAMWGKLGKPEEASGYSVEWGDGIDDAFKDGLAKTFHDANLTDEQAKVLYEKYNELNDGLANEAQEQKTQQWQVELDGLQREQGTAWKEYVGGANRAAQKLGLTAEDLGAMDALYGPAWTVKHLASIAKALGGEVTLPNDQTPGNASTTGMSAPDAKARLAALESNADWQARILNKDKTALQERRNLISIMHGG